MPGSASEWLDLSLRALGAVAGGLVTLAAAVYGVQRTLKKDRRDDTHADLLGRSHANIFEQYEGIISVMRRELTELDERYKALRNANDQINERLTIAGRRILELELENKVKRQIIAELVEDMRRVKRGNLDPDDLNTGIYESHLHS